MTEPRSEAGVALMYQNNRDENSRNDIRLNSEAAEEYKDHKRNGHAGLCRGPVLDCRREERKHYPAGKCAQQYEEKEHEVAARLRGEASHPIDKRAVDQSVL